MRSIKRTCSQLLLGVVLAFGSIVSPIHAQPTLPGDGEEGGGGTNGTPSFFINTNRNYVKFMLHKFQLLDTNSIAETDTNLYAALAAFPADTNTEPALQVALFDAYTLLLKASRFDFSAENSRSFALLICDKVETPVWKSIDLEGNYAAQDGWLVQGSVPAWQVSETMFFKIANFARDCNAFFRAIPYGGPIVTITNLQAYDVVSNVTALAVEISDLSGVSNVLVQVNLDGVPARCNFSSNNIIELHTKYHPEGLANIYINAINDAVVYNPTNPPDNARFSFEASTSLPLQFENDTFLLWASDYCPPEAGTNYFFFVTDRPQTITASISSPEDNRVVASYGGYVPYAATISLEWNFTEADGTTPYSNDAYVVSFETSNPTTLTFTNKIDRNGRIRDPGGCLLTFQYEDPNTQEGNFLNQRAETAIRQDLLFLFQWQYSQISLTQYGVQDVGPNRNLAQCWVYDGPMKSWADTLGVITNPALSEFTIAQAHNSGGQLGGGGYLPDRIDALDLYTWVLSGKGPVGGGWRLRKASMFTCYSGNILLSSAGTYFTWADGCGIRPAGLQETSVMYKNCGLFFAEGLPQVFDDTTLGGVKAAAEVAAIFDQTWVCGKYQYPGGCDPTYSFDFAIRATVGRFPGMTNAAPRIGGYRHCVYSSIYDEELRNLGLTHVKQN